MQGVNNPHSGKGAQNPGRTLLRLLAYTFSRWKGATVLVVLCVVLAASANIVSVSRLAPIAAELMEKGADADMPFIYRNILIMGVIYIVGVVSTFSYNRIMMYIAQGTLRRLRDEIFEKMQRLPMGLFDANTHGDLMSLYTNDVDTMRQLLSQTIPQIISSCITMTMAIAFMLYYSLTLTLVVVVALTLILSFVRRNGGRSSRCFLQQQVAIGKLNGFVEEMTGGQKVIKTFCHEEKAQEQFRILNDELNRVRRQANTYAFIMGPVNGNLSYLQYIAVAMVGVLTILFCGEKGLLSLYCIRQGGGVAAAAGVLVSFLAYSRQINGPVQQVSQQFNAIVMALAGAERVFALMDTQPEDPGGEITLTRDERGAWVWREPAEDGSCRDIPLKGDIRFDDVVFGYTSEKVILKHISLYAKPGQKIAFVGSTGAGKTTITNLINRFYDIQSGKITYDGLDIRRIRKDDLRRSLGVVLQDTHLFTGTVMDNIRYGRLDATDDDCIRAAKLANAHFFISHLPEGYQTILTGDGANLSQGQRQLLAIARAMVSDCPVLILDEATSSIDTRTEKLIEQGMDRLMEGRTVFVIATGFPPSGTAMLLWYWSMGRSLSGAAISSCWPRRGNITSSIQAPLNWNDSLMPALDKRNQMDIICNWLLIIKEWDDAGYDAVWSENCHYQPGFP